MNNSYHFTQSTANMDSFFSFSIIISIIYLVIYVGMAVLMCFLCNKFAKEKNFPPSYKWFGLLGIIGLIIVLILPSKKPNPMMEYYMNNMNSNSSNATVNNDNVINSNSLGTTNNSSNSGTTNNSAKYCVNCGTAIPNGSSFCANCGHKI